MEVIHKWIYLLGQACPKQNPSYLGYHYKDLKSKFGKQTANLTSGPFIPPTTNHYFHHRQMER